MLISLWLENFRSFDGEQEFSMVASPRQTNFQEHLVEVPGIDVKLVPVAAVFGANGSGKSNLVRALSWVRALVIGGPFRQEPFLFAAPERDSRIELRLLCGDQVLQYGFSFGPEGIRTEWLATVSASGRERLLFERKPELAFDKSIASEKLAALKVLGVHHHELLLTKLAHELRDELPAQLAAAMEWFRRLLIVTGEAPARVHDDAFRQYAAQLLRRVDTTIVDIHARDPIAFEHAGPNGQRATLGFDQQSAGTRRLLDLAPAAFDAASNVVAVVDELDRSLHALLVREFLVEFLRRAKGHQSQLLFTTHETHVLDQELLRRDEVWFAEKNEHGATELHSLDDFKVRNDLRLDRSYLQGRFGGVPLLATELLRGT